MPVGPVRLSAEATSTSNQIVQHGRRPGPSLFPSNNHGTLSFEPAAPQSQNNTAEFITVGSEVDSLGLLRFLENSWRLPTPELIISVTGGAQDFELSPTLLAMFCGGLSATAAETKAWVVTGGTDSGVMRLVGRAMRGVTSETGAAVPVLGITPLGGCSGREPLLSCHGEEIQYVGKNAGAGETSVPLNPGHTHFVLVDSRLKEGVTPWGSEVETRTGLEMCCHDEGIPTVLVVVRGGKNTLKTVSEHIRRGNVPIVCLADSGGVAAAIRAYVKQGAEACLKIFPKFDAQRGEFEAIAAANKAASGRLVTFFEMRLLGQELTQRSHQVGDGQRRWFGKTHLSRAILTAVLGMLRRNVGEPHSPESPSRHLRLDPEMKVLQLAVSLGLADFVEDILHDQYEAPPEEMLRKALQLALESRQCAAVVDSLTRQSRLAGINVSRLYMRSPCIQKPYLRDLLERLSKREGDVKILSASEQQAYNTYQQIIGPFLGNLHPLLQKIVESASQASAFDVFLWAIIVGHNEIAWIMWRRTAQPIYAALLGAHVLRELSGRAKGMCVELETRGDMLEGWACSALDMAPHDEAYRVLDAPLAVVLDPKRLKRPHTLMELAAATRMKRFLHLAACTTLSDKRWRGDRIGKVDHARVYHASINWFWLCLFALFPLCNPYIVTSRRFDVFDTFSASIAEGRESAARAGGLLDRFRAFYSMPAVVFLLHFLAQVGFAAAAIAHVVESALPSEVVEHGVPGFGKPANLFRHFGAYWIFQLAATLDMSRSEIN